MKTQRKNILTLGSIGGVDSGKTRQIIFPHKCVNIELQNILIQSLNIDNRSNIWKNHFSKSNILQTMYKCREYLTQIENYLAMTDCCRSANGNYMRTNGYVDIQPLTSRQSSCANAVIRNIITQHWENALHEFLDCIDNFGECETEARLITINEYVLYSCLIQAFICALDNQNESSNTQTESLTTEE